jgi:hypothetical protein
VVGLEIENEWGITEHPQGGGGEDGTLQAMGRVLMQDGPRRPGGMCEMVRQVVQKTLDAMRSLESMERAKL